MNTVFVFGSNTAGIHGAGAAKEAFQNHGAKFHHGYGICGNSFAIPTKDKYIQSLPTAAVESFVMGFLAFAEDRSDLTFKVTRIGCGLAGFNDATMALMFVNASANCLFDSKWKPYFDVYIEEGGLQWNPQYWGTY